MPTLEGNMLYALILGGFAVIAIVFAGLLAWSQREPRSRHRRHRGHDRRQRGHRNQPATPEKMKVYTVVNGQRAPRTPKQMPPPASGPTSQPTAPTSSNQSQQPSTPYNDYPLAFTLTYREIQAAAAKRGLNTTTCPAVFVPIWGPGNVDLARGIGTSAGDHGNGWLVRYVRNGLNQQVLCIAHVGSQDDLSHISRGRYRVWSA